MNKNITENNWYAQNMDPELDPKLDAFDQTIAETFGSEVKYIEHFIYTERLSFTKVKFNDGEYIEFSVTTKAVVDEGYQASADKLRRAYNAFNIELPYWMYRRNA